MTRALRALDGNRRRLRKLVATLREDGFMESVVLLRGYIEYRCEKRFGSRIDRKYGCDTGGRIPLDRLEIDSPNLKEGVQYEPVSETYFHRMLAAVCIPPDSYVFVDLGAGKGRALLLAAEYPFKRLIGVDFSPEMLELALQNIARFRDRTRFEQTFELHLGDAVTFDFPPEPIALHLFNPFGERVLRRVVDRLHASLRETPRDVLVFYKTPLHAHVLRESPFLSPVKVTSQYAVYRSR